MKLYTLKDKKVNISEELQSVDFALSCDILCVGAGAAGSYAAESAAQEGSDVILIEYSSCIGGMHIRGNVCSYYYGDEGGSYLETDGACTRDVFLAGNQQPETKQSLLYKKLKRSGVKLLCNHCPIGLYVDGDRIKGVLVLSDDGIYSIKAKMVIDSTSDGHLIRMLPVEKTYGRKIDGKTVPFTVRTQYFANGCFMSINSDSGYTDQYDRTDFSKKTILAHANATKFLDKGAFINVASITGVREGLSFEGEEAITCTDIIFDKPCEKPLFYAYSDLDKHGQDLALDDELFQNWFVISNLATVTFAIPVPMGCIVPKGFKGIVTAGRCISSDSYALTSIRMNRDMFRMGECIGVASSMAVRDNCDFISINYPEYLKKVNSRGCFKSNKDRKIGFDNSYSRSGTAYKPVRFDVEANLDLLKTTTPGVIIWSCFIASDKDQTADIIYDRLVSADSDLEKYNCAIALGIMNDKRAVNVLRDIIENRDDFRFTDCRRSNQLRSAIALCLMGRLGESTDTACLERIVFDDGEFEKSIYTPIVKDNTHYNTVYFDIFTHACMSLVKLYKAHNMDISSLHNRFNALFEGEKIIRRMTTAACGEPDYIEIQDFQKHLLKITEA